MRNYTDQIKADQLLAQKRKQDTLKNIRTAKLLTAINVSMIVTNVTLFCIRIFMQKG